MQEPIPIEKLHNSQFGNCQGSRNHLAWGLMVPGPRRLPHWELCDFSMGMGSCCIHMCVMFISCYWLSNLCRDNSHNTQTHSIRQQQWYTHPLDVSDYDVVCNYIIRLVLCWSLPSDCVIKSGGDDGGRWRRMEEDEEVRWRENVVLFYMWWTGGLAAAVWRNARACFITLYSVQTHVTTGQFHIHTTYKT